MLKVDTTLAQLSGATLFSKLEANSGFWQILLANESKLLTTFITPIGKFCFNKLLFGISIAPEIYQRHMNELVLGLPGGCFSMSMIFWFIVKTQLDMNPVYRLHLR